MPFYDYRCSVCGRTFEEQKPVDKRDDAVCPECGSDEVERLITAVSAWARGGCSSPSSGGG